jgi:hypothetical protein
MFREEIPEHEGGNILRKIDIYLLNDVIFQITVVVMMGNILGIVSSR